MRSAARVRLRQAGRTHKRGFGYRMINGSNKQTAFRQTTSLMLAGLLSGACLSDRLAAQPFRVALSGRDEVEKTHEYFSAVLHPSEEATTLLSRAREGAARRDWKLVVDSLQRIIELPGDHILATNENLYQSARHHAVRELAALPPEGLRAYRLIYDGQAAAIYRKALEEHDEAALRRLVDRCLVTSVGDDAAVTLADWLTDEGRFLEAGTLLRLVAEVYPDSDLPKEMVLLRLGVCMWGMGRPDQASTIVDQLDSRPVESDSAFAARLAQIREFLARSSPGESDPGGHGWPMAYGRSSRDGIMSPVEPKFISHLPWNVPLPVPQPQSGVSQVKDYAEQHGLIPATEMASDGRIMVVKSGSNLLALDGDTFDPLWAGRTEDDDANLVDLESPAPQWQVWGGAVQPRPADDRVAADRPLIRRLYHDTVGNQLCIAAGMVLSVEWPGEPPDTLTARRDRGLRRLTVPMAGGAQSQPNFIVACSTTDGHRLWTSDTTSGPHALGPVEFLAAPLPVEGLLLAPGRLNDDLYAVLLDPRTGKITGQIYLCGTGGASFDSLYTCMPSAADGTVFIPTGRGVVVAIDTAGWSVRWAVRYDHIGTVANELTWTIPSPAIAARDLLLVGPPDADELFAIERVTGKIRWHVAREGALYVLAADRSRVWTVGPQVRAYDVETGRRIWTADSDIPAGRGAKSGDRLYLPTRSGMMVLDAGSGDRLDEQPTVPPGNLLAYDGSLYVASAFEIRKYPDMNRGYDKAVLAHRQAPADLSLSMRLAWLEYLRGKPGEALAALASVPESARDQEEERYARLVHLKVLSMLDLAADAGTTSKQALKLLEDAQRVAQTAEDAITARLALAGQYQRDESPDARLKACLEYVALALDPTGDQMMSEDGDAYERKATLVASRRLHDLLPGLSAEETESLNERLQQRLTRAILGRDAAQLRRMSICSALNRLGIQADMVLAIWAARDLAYEQAEACLRRVLRRAESPALVAEALARLAVIELQPGELHQPVSAAGWLKRLEGELAVVEIPADVLEPEWPAPTESEATPERSITAARAARALRQRIDNRVFSQHEKALAPVILGAPGKPPEVTAYQNARPIVLRGKRSEPLTDRMLLFVDDRAVEARRRGNGELLWPAELRLLGEMMVESRTTVEGTRFGPRRGPVQPARAVADGQTLMINTRFGVHAVGLLTGRRLWSRRFDPPAPSDQNAAGSDDWVWAQDGHVATVDNYGRLEVARCEAGSDVLWRRRMIDRRWQTVRSFGKYLVAGDSDLEHLDVFQLADGIHLGVCEFDQPDEPDRAVNVAAADDVICGPISPRHVVALELGTPGVERWRVEMNTDLSQIFKPSPDMVAVADRAGGLKLIDPASGQAKLDVQVPACPEGVVDGRLDAGVLYVYGLQKRSEPGRPTTDRRQWAMAAIRVSDGVVLWNRSDLGSQLCLVSEVLTASSNAIPLMVYRPLITEARLDQGNGQITVSVPRTRAQVELAILDKSTGATIGETVSMNVEGLEGAAVLLDLQVWPERITAFVGANHASFELRPPGELFAPSSLEKGN